MLRQNLLSVLFACCCGLLLSLLFNSTSKLSSTPGFYSLVYFAVFCFGFNLLYAFRAGTASFTGLLVAGIVIKLLLAFVIVFVYSLIDPPGFIAFSAHFISHYVLFTIFEIGYLLRLIKLKHSHEKTTGL